MTIENENEILEWMKTFESLPEDRRDLVHRWFATQKLIIDNSGITVEDWFNHVQWAIENPFDYSFVMNFPDKEEAGGPADNTKTTDETQRARQLVGAQPHTARTEASPTIKDKATSERGLEKELFSRFMSEQMKKGKSD
jgi:hypothetical protein